MLFPKTIENSLPFFEATVKRPVHLLQWVLEVSPTLKKKPLPFPLGASMNCPLLQAPINYEYQAIKHYFFP